MKIDNKIIIVLIALAILAGFFGGSYYQKSIIAGSTLPILQGNTKSDPSVDISLFWSVWNELHDKYVDKQKLNDKDLLYGAIDGLVKKVGDPYTTFFTPKESQSFNEEVNGAFGGVGIEIGIRNEALTVITPIKNTPAEKAGLQAGDRILKIGDKSTLDMKVEEAVNLIRGKKGTPVVLTFIHSSKDAKEQSATIIRDTIKIPAVTWEMKDNDTAYIQLFIFNKNVDDEFEKAAREIIASKAKRIVLDVRNNPGGLLDSAINVAGYFLKNNSLVILEQDDKGAKRDYRSQREPIFLKYPVVMLINKGSASASEILAGALKDNRNITLVGEKSFGKGSVQTVLDLAGGTSLKITVAKWLTPKGISINDNGISPDILVERSVEDINANKDPQLDRALQIIKDK